MDFIVRACRNRRLEDAPLLYDQLGEISAADTYRITVRRQINQAERQAVVDIRYATVTLLPPKRTKSTEAIPLEPLQVQIVEGREVDPLADVKEPIHWILMTTLPVESLAVAHQIVSFYTYRWLVERFHYVFKSGGCHFEDSQLRAIAKLGGFIGRKSDGDPGVKTLWRGWQRLQDIVATWSLFHPPARCG